MPNTPARTRERKVTVIFDPEKVEKMPAEFAAQRKKRVAAYARVSTEQEEQQSSYGAQIDYYKGFIQSNPDWEYVDVYADEGISGTSYKKRDGFNRMIKDALGGKIDLILTKSISRFARNTVDALTKTRELKAKGVEVRFEKENISSMDPQAELIFTIMSSVAQEESRSISENVRWGQQRSMEAGKVSVAWSHFLGYKKGPDGLPMIVEEEAEIVRKIYSAYLDGKTFKQIAEDLTKAGYETPSGNVIWSRETVRSILTNEKYKGDARLQKTYTVDFLTKEVKVNRGERKQWYIKDSHDAIVSPETFELVQKEIERRCARKGKYFDSPFTGKVICGSCGAYYGRRVWHAGSKHQKHIWLCNDKYSDGKTCPSPKIEEPEIERAFLVTLKRIFAIAGKYTEDYCQAFLSAIGDTSKQEKKLQSLSEEFSALVDQIEQLVKDNSKKAQDQDEYAKMFEALSAQIRQKKTEMEAVEKEISDAIIHKESVRIYLDGLGSLDSAINKFDIAVWHKLVDYVSVMPDKTFVFRMRDDHDEIVSPEEAH